MTQKISEVATKWWADHLRNGSKNDNGDDNPLTSMLSAMLQQKTLSQISNDQIDAFENKLSEIIESQKVRILDVDYDPDIYLSDAAQEAGIPLSIGVLPMKTIMWIDEDKIQVRYGYGAARETIYSTQ